MTETMKTSHETTDEMSVVDRKFEARNEVSTMTTSTISAPVTLRSSADYSLAERAVAAFALGMLRWSNRRADRLAPTHERMKKILENERATSAVRDGRSIH